MAPYLLGNQRKLLRKLGAYWRGHIARDQKEVCTIAGISALSVRRELPPTLA